MPGTSFFTPGYQPTENELRLFATLADYEELVNDLLTICRYLLEGSSHASRSSEDSPSDTACASTPPPMVHFQPGRTELHDWSE
jgi:hypothetical protein